MNVVYHPSPEKERRGVPSLLDKIGRNTLVPLFLISQILMSFLYNVNAKMLFSFWGSCLLLVLLGSEVEGSRGLFFKKIVFFFLIDCYQLSAGNK